MSLSSERHAVSAGLLLLTIALAVITCAPADAIAQRSGFGWDADDSCPPPTSTYRPLARPDKPVLLHLIIYPEGGHVHRSISDSLSPMRIELASPVAAIAFDSWSTDSTMEIRVIRGPGARQSGTAEPRLGMHPAQADEYHVPIRDFDLTIVYASDTGRYHVQRRPLLAVECTRKARMITLDSALHVPEGLECAVLESKMAASLTTLLDSLKARFGDRVTNVTLKNGFYPHLGNSWVGRMALGRRQSVNLIGDKYLICLRIPNPDKAKECAAWLSSHGAVLVLEKEGV